MSERDNKQRQVYKYSLESEERGVLIKKDFEFPIEGWTITLIGDPKIEKRSSVVLPGLKSIDIFPIATPKKNDSISVVEQYQNEALLRNGPANHEEKREMRELMELTNMYSEIQDRNKSKSVDQMWEELRLKVLVPERMGVKESEVEAKRTATSIFSGWRSKAKKLGLAALAATATATSIAVGWGVWEGIKHPENRPVRPGDWAPLYSDELRTGEGSVLPGSTAEPGSHNVLVIRERVIPTLASQVIPVPRVLEGDEYGIYKPYPKHEEVEANSVERVFVPSDEVRTIFENVDPNSLIAKTVNYYVNKETASAIRNIGTVGAIFPTEGPQGEKLQPQNAGLMEWFDAEWVKFAKGNGGFDMRNREDLLLLQQVKQTEKYEIARRLFIGDLLTRYTHNELEGFELDGERIQDVVDRADRPEPYIVLSPKDLYNSNLKLQR